MIIKHRDTIRAEWATTRNQNRAKRALTGGGITGW
jgi:hypothetical protein